MSIKLNNMGTPVIWLAREGWGGERPFIGLVVAYLFSSHHNYVVWNMSSQDGESWDCSHGDYVHELSEAVDIFNDRAKFICETAQCMKAKFKREERELAEWLADQEKRQAQDGGIIHLSPEGNFCDVCGVEMTSGNTSMMLTATCGNCNSVERGY
jgi:hypothetical protein